MNRSTSVTAPVRYVISVEVESAYSEPITLGRVDTLEEARQAVRRHISGTAALAADPVAEQWQDRNETIVRHASGTHYAYRVTDEHR